MTDILQAVGAIAGIGGISVAVFLLICKSIISKVNWPEPTKDQSYNLLNRMIVLSFFVATMGLLAYVAVVGIRHAVDAAKQTADSGGTGSVKIDVISSQSASTYSGRSKTSSSQRHLLESIYPHPAVPRAMLKALASKKEMTDEELSIDITSILLGRGIDQNNDINITDLVVSYVRHFAIDQVDDTETRQQFSLKGYRGECGPDGKMRHHLDSQ